MSKALSEMLPPYFVGKLDYHCEPEDDYTMVLDAPLKFVDDEGETEAPAKLVTDGASVKQLLELPLIGIITRFVLAGDQFTGPFRWPATVHDGDYGRATETSWWKALISRDRARADRRIREGAMTRLVAVRMVSGVCQCSICVDVHERTPAAAWRAWAVWALLRLFGFKAWMDDSSKAQTSLAKLTVGS